MGRLLTLRKPHMSKNRETDEIRAALDKLTAELKLTRIAFAALHTTIEEMIYRDEAEFSPGYTSVRRDMN
jgi:hypothetical protein